MTREEILDEIRQLSEGGRAPGRERFVRETGISEYQINRFWPRWSDAVAEAGLRRNEMQAAYTDGVLMSSLVTLIRHLGKFPAKGDMLVRRNRDPTFPSEKVFSRYGGKADLVERVSAYAREQGFDDVVAICEGTLVPKRPVENADRETRFGWVYLISGRKGEYKIGHSTDAEKRVGQLATGSAVQLTIVHAIKTDDPAGVEAYWHRRLAAKRMRPDGEWFRLSAAEVNAFKRWRKLY